MASQDAERSETRPPTIDDLVTVCKRLNEEKAKYVLIGGFAINYYGFPRSTEDIDLLVDPSEENILKIKNALSFLPDNAVKEINTDDIEKYEVVRIADEIIIDLLKKACDITYDKSNIEYFDFRGVSIPIADISTMIGTKQGIRPRDKEDLAFLLSIIENKNINNCTWIFISGNSNIFWRSDNINITNKSLIIESLDNNAEKVPGLYSETDWRGVYKICAS